MHPSELELRSELAAGRSHPPPRQADARPGALAREHRVLTKRRRARNTAVCTVSAPRAGDKMGSKTAKGRARPSWAQRGPAAMDR